MLRQLRSRKFRKKYYVLIVSIQILVLWYFMIIGGIYLNGYTNASFNDIENVTASFHVSWTSEDDSKEWDKSSLEFRKQGGGCDVIWAEIKNGGNKNMAGPSKFEIYFVESGNPKKGEMIFQGVIPPLKSGETTTLTFSNPIAFGNGIFKFKGYQRPGHPNSDGNNGKNNGNKEGALWSEDIILNSCPKQNLTNEGSEEPKLEDETKENQPEKIPNTEGDLASKKELNDSSNSVEEISPLGEEVSRDYQDKSLELGNQEENSNP